MRTAIRLAITIAVATAAACGSEQPSVLSGASAPAAASPSAAAAARYPASAVRVTVNGVERAPGAEVVVDGLSPTAIALVFPFAVDRSSIQTWLPRTGSPQWIDDRTLVLVFPETEPLNGFKVPQVRSVDGLSTLDLFVLNIRYAPSAVLSVYAIAGALAAGGPTASASWRVPGIDRVTSFAASTDLSRVLVYPRGGSPGQSARVVTLATRSTATLALDGNDGPFAFGGWLPNGDVILVGASVWSGPVAGTALRRVAELPAPAAAAEPSPRGSYVAVAGPDRIRVVDLRDGTVRTVSGSSGGCVPGIAWSSDETKLAWLDCAAASVRVTELSRDRVVRTIATDAKNVTALATGDVIVTRGSGETGAGARSLGVVYGFDGTEKARYLGYAWSVSPDGRYLLNIGSCCAGGPTSTLTDLGAPAMPPVVLPGIASWTADGRILVASTAQ